MNKIVIVISIVALVAVAIGWRVFSQPGTVTAPSDNSKTPNDSDYSNTTNQFQGSLIDLVRLGQNYTCTFEYTDEVGNVNSGRVYIAESGNKMNGEFITTLTSDEPATTTNIITDSTYSYIWSDQMEQGYKYAINDYEDSLLGQTAGESENNEAAQSFDDKQDIDFDCNPWNIDNSMFVPPSDIEFIDVNTQMEQMQEMQEEAMEESEESDIGERNISCDTCNQVPSGDSREQCLQALNCN